MLELDLEKKLQALFVDLAQSLIDVWSLELVMPRRRLE